MLIAPSLMLPAPLAVQVPPPAPTQVHVQVRLAGNVSATVEPDAALGPALLAVIVYVTLPPAEAVGVGRGVVARVEVGRRAAADRRRVGKRARRARTDRAARGVGRRAAGR